MPGILSTGFTVLGLVPKILLASSLWSPKLNLALDSLLITQKILVEHYYIPG